jgi:hypothetical protein
VKKKFAAIQLILFFSLITAKAQFQSSVSNYFDSTGNKTGIIADYNINSSFLNSAFYSGWTSKKNINTETKNNIIARLSNENTAGGDISYRIFSSINASNDSASRRYFISIASREHFNTGLPRDFVKLMLFGNKQFAGDTAFLTGINFTYLRYQQIEAGLLWNYEDRHKYGFSLSYLNGAANMQMLTGKSFLYTDKNGEYITLGIKGNYYRSDTSKTEYFSNNGWGISANLFYEYLINDSIGRQSIKFEASDWGFIRWNNNSEQYIRDTAITYKGVYINDVFALNDSVFQNLNPDSALGISANKYIKQAYTGFLPAFMKVSYNMIKSAHNIEAGMYYRTGGNFFPMMFISDQFTITDYLSIGGRLAYGGYGRLNSGVNLHFNFHKYLIQIGSNNIESYILPEKTGGSSLYFYFAKQF